MNTIGVTEDIMFNELGLLGNSIGVDSFLSDSFSARKADWVFDAVEEDPDLLVRKSQRDLWAVTTDGQIVRLFDAEAEPILLEREGMARVASLRRAKIARECLEMTGCVQFESEEF
jgi:hypothetical protein